MYHTEAGVSKDADTFTGESIPRFALRTLEVSFMYTTHSFRRAEGLSLEKLTR